MPDHWIGPAGYTAAIYASRANLEPLLIEGMQPGGQLTASMEVENFPGYPEGVSGPQMMEDFRRQAERFGTEIRSGRVTSVDFSVRPFKATIDNEYTVEADTVIVATGATANYLGLPDEKKYAGRGVSACATCDGFFYRNKKVAVVGGGDTACEEALYLAGLAEKVYMIVRKPYLRASRIMQERVMNHPKIEILFEHNVVGLFGEDGVEVRIWLNEWGNPMRRNGILLSTGCFLPSGIHQTPIFSKIFLNWMRRGTSKPVVRVPIPMWKVFLRQAMWPTPFTVRL